MKRCCVSNMAPAIFCLGGLCSICNCWGWAKTVIPLQLLPGQPVLDERQRWVAVVPEGRLEPRITLTYPALESSRLTLFLVSGGAKEEMLARARAGGNLFPQGRLDRRAM